MFNNRFEAFIDKFKTGKLFYFTRLEFLFQQLIDVGGALYVESRLVICQFLVCVRVVDEVNSLVYSQFIVLDYIACQFVYSSVY